MKNVLIIIALILAIIGVAYMIGDNKEEKQIISAYDEIYQIQKEVDKEIAKFIEDNSYTIENPKIMLNPYKLSPLTALVIFQTEKEQTVEVSVNNSKMTTMESTTKHAIPIYGMYADYENIIELKLNDGTAKQLTIKTDKYEGEEVILEQTSNEVVNNLYLLSPNFVNNCIIDGKGNVVWYLKGDYAGDIEYLDNGHFYISDPHQGRNGVKINYSSFVEMDYLGKIHKQWVIEYGLHHELVQLSDNKMIALGASDSSNFFDSYICMIDLETGKTLKYIDLYELLHNIDAKLIESLGTSFDLVNNSVDYNEQTGDMLISLRGLNSLMKLNFNTSEIKWIFGDKEFWGENFAKYMLKIQDDTRILGGQHSAFYTSDGLIAVHNNDIDQFDLTNANLSHYLDRYTSCDFYKVDEENMTIETVWQYTANKELFSNVAGHIELLENGHKLITYGWAMTEEAYQNPEEVLYTDPVYKNGIVREIDTSGNTVFEARMAGLIYRTYKLDSLYKLQTENYKITEFNRINGTETNAKIVEKDTIEKALKKAEKYNNKLEIITNRVYINDELQLTDSADVIFVGENDKVYVYSYKEAGKEGPKSFNSGYVSKKMNVPTGKYEAYIKINEDYYDTDLIIEF